MIRNKKEEKAKRIPVQFADEEPQSQVEPKGPGGDGVDVASPNDDLDNVSINENMSGAQLDSQDENEAGVTELAEVGETQTPSATASESLDTVEDLSIADSTAAVGEDHASPQDNKPTAGPMLAELLATRAELRRVETERNDLLERLARRQADFENYRKRVERERGETYQRMVGDVVSKLLPVMDNMRRALQAESILEKNESAEFRHFLRGVELIYKQLNDALQELGVEPVPAVGQPFDPHVHEAVATEHSDEYEPDTVTQELLRGYRLGEKLLRPAMVKVSTRQ